MSSRAHSCLEFVEAVAGCGTALVLTVLCSAAVWKHAPRQPLQNRPSGHFGGQATPLSAEKMFDGRRQRVSVPVHARTAHKWPPAEKARGGSLLNGPSCPSDDPIGQVAELNCSAAGHCLGKIDRCSPERSTQNNAHFMYGRTGWVALLL